MLPGGGFGFGGYLAAMRQRIYDILEKEHGQDRIGRVVDLALITLIVLNERTDPRLVMKLFEMEVPEIYDGTVLIKGAVREAGERAKVAVLDINEENAKAVADDIQSSWDALK